MKNQQEVDPKQETPEINKDQLKPQIQFYDQFCRVFLANKILTAQLQELTNHQTHLLSRLSKLQTKEDDGESLESNASDKKKRIRRMASQIQRHYQCKAPGCGKSYGSEGSLNQHMKFKHQELCNELPITATNVKEQQNKNIVFRYD